MNAAGAADSTKTFEAEPFFTLDQRGRRLWLALTRALAEGPAELDENGRMTTSGGECARPQREDQASHAFRPDPFESNRCCQYFDDAGAAIIVSAGNIAKPCGRPRAEYAA